MEISEMFSSRVEGGLRLIAPLHSAAVANAPWTKDTIHYRSRVETVDGLTVSQGFKKFFNLGTGPLDLQITVNDVVEACDHQDAVATLKLDGSLLIRSINDEKVMLRTRGSFGYEHLANADEIQLFKEKYPKLFYANRFHDFSLLFEWVSPRNVIVLKYPEPGLTLIGAVYHPTLRYSNVEQLKIIADIIDVPLVEHFPLDAKGWAELQSKLEENQEIEGYVIRLHDEQDLVKVKCLPYLTKHALKSTLTTEKLADMYFQQGRPSFTDFCKSFTSAFDEETFMWALPAISSMFDGVSTLKKIESHMAAKALERKELSRKEAALTGIAEYGQTKRFSAYMNLWEGKPVKTELLKSILLQNSKQVEMGMFHGPEITTGVNPLADE